MMASTEAPREVPDQLTTKFAAKNDDAPQILIVVDVADRFLTRPERRPYTASSEHNICRLSPAPRLRGQEPRLGDDYRGIFSAT